MFGQLSGCLKEGGSRSREGLLGAGHSSLVQVGNREGPPLGLLGESLRQVSPLGLLGKSLQQVPPFILLQSFLGWEELGVRGPSHRFICL